jgi:hypothetical protein
MRRTPRHRSLWLGSGSWRRTSLEGPLRRLRSSRGRLRRPPSSRRWPRPRGSPKRCPPPTWAASCTYASCSPNPLTALQPSAPSSAPQCTTCPGQPHWSAVTPQRGWTQRMRPGTTATIVVRALLVPALALDAGRFIWWPSRIAREIRPASGPFRVARETLCWSVGARCKPVEKSGAKGWQAPPPILPLRGPSAAIPLGHAALPICSPRPGLPPRGECVSPSPHPRPGPSLKVLVVGIEDQP